MIRTSPIRTSIAVALLATVAVAAPARADVDVHVNITPPSFVFAAPPHLVVVPGHPRVHYAPDVAVSFFAYGGRYYTYDNGYWFSAHDNRGPWAYIERRHVPSYVLNVPGRYYHVPPRLVGGGHWRHGGHGKYSHGKYKGGHGKYKGGHGKGHGHKKHRH